MALRVPIGLDDFQTLRETNLAYVDKTYFVRDLLDVPGVQVALFPRPRRFGKTLNLSMLRCFFEKRDEDFSHLFRDLSIWQAGDDYRAHFQRYPVIHFNFKDTKGETFELFYAATCNRIAALFDAHRYLLEDGRLSEREARDYRAVLDGSAGRPIIEQALADLSAYLHRHHGQKVVILIDEYDAPIHIAQMGGWARPILDFMRPFLGAGLKSNPHLFRAVITGILHIAKESLFSDVNNIRVYSLLDPSFRTCFGFTEPEVVALLERAGAQDRLEAVRTWYNGYLFGGEIVYNPWSVVCFLEDTTQPPRAHWVSTSSNDLVRDLLQLHAPDMQPVLETLLSGGSVDRVLDDNVVLSELRASRGALFSLLVFTGYLNARALPPDPGTEKRTYRLSIPNREVRQVYSTTFQRWLERRLQGHGGDLEKLTSAILRGDAAGLEEQLQAFVWNLLSYQDTGVVDPEGVYHGFVLGLLAVMEPAHLVRSNRESGEGRPDVMIRPRDPGNPAAILELKVARKGGMTPAAALRQGLQQIERQRYEAELLAAGASAVHAFAVAFDGKKVWVKAAPSRPDTRRGAGRKTGSRPPAKTGSRSTAKSHTSSRAKAGKGSRA